METAETHFSLGENEPESGPLKGRHLPSGEKRDSDVQERLRPNTCLLHSGLRFSF